MKAGVVATDGARTLSLLLTPHRTTPPQPPPHPYQNSIFFFFCLSNSNSKVTLCYIYLAGAAERKENAFKRLGFAPEEGTVKQEEREKEKKKNHITGTFACQSCQTFLLHSDIYKVEEGLRAPAFPDSRNENRQSN